MRRAFLRCPAVALLAAVATACGGAGSPSTASPAVTVSPSPTAPPTAQATTDDRRVTVVETGLGVYLETTAPVAVLRNAATAHAARAVDVHLAVVAGTRTLGTADTRVDAIAPGATATVAARVQGAAVRGETVTATVTVGTWEAGPGPPPPASAGQATFSCPGCGAGPASGDVSATLTPAGTLGAGTTLLLTAVCRDAASHLVGGGTRLFAVASATGSPFPVEVPAVVSARPRSCAVEAGASAGL